MALDGIDCFGHGLWCRQIAQAPTCHCVRFAEAVDRNCEIVCCRRERPDAHMFRIIINELLVYFVRQNVNVFFRGNIDNSL